MHPLVGLAAVHRFGNDQQLPTSIRLEPIPLVLGEFKASAVIEDDLDPPIDTSDRLDVPTLREDNGGVLERRIRVY